MSDDLFQPTISQAPQPTVSPWRPESILYPAFFGGPMAAAALGFLNGRKLSLRAGALGAIVAAGLAGFVARAFVTSLMEGMSGTRVIGAGAGVLAWLVVMAFQRRPFRIFLYNDGEPASLVGPGIAAAVGLGVLEAIIIYVVVV